EAENDRKIHLYHCDHLGTPLALVDREGHIDWHITLDPWGNVLSEHNPQQLHQPLRMQGQQYDEESGLHYNRHRYYDPALGRYISQDPIGLAGGWNTYIYPLNPLLEIDPLGLETQRCIKPLHSLGGTGERSGPDIWGNPFYHQYLCVPDGKGGHICGGQDQRGEKWYDGFWGPGKSSVDKLDDAGKCETVESDNKCIEECLKRKFSGSRPRYSVLPDLFTPVRLGLLKNCQDWSNDSFNSCKQKCNGNNIRRLLNFIYKGVL
ncbi:RHS repeat-associated core domain-containing protein, partial [Buttiauxella sp.]|uniref:RHS repeat-associated core domain-containing protein n=1 Tax=Buttiauxella sp. TaxID=1972222 RepID=UPI003C716FFF